MASDDPKSAKKLHPVSFRFSEETSEKLKIIATINKRSASNMAEVLIENAYEDLKERRPEDLRRIQRAFRDLKR